MEKKLDRGFTILDVDFFTIFIAQKSKDLRASYAYPWGVKNTRVILTPALTTF
jgi:hypothetical protein